MDTETIYNFFGEEMILLTVLSVFLQFTAAYLAVRMIRITGEHKAWALISFAITIGALRRSYELIRMIFADAGTPHNTIGEVLSFLTSLCMVIGVAYIAPLFRSIKKSEEELRKSEKNLLAETNFSDTIFNSAADGMRVLDKNFNPLRLNKTFLNMLDATEEGSMGEKCYEMFPCPRRNTPNCSITRVMKGEENFEEEIIVERKDGKKISCILHVTPLNGSDGSVIGIIEDFKDITERKKLQFQLMQSQKMEAVGRLAGGIAHDFNNLLTPIVGYSDLVLTQLPVNHFAKDKLEVIRNAGDKAADLVKQLLAFSRKQALEMGPLNINEIVWDMNKIFSRTIGEDIKLELNTLNPVKNILADEGQVEQVLMNLVINARDAMPEGGRLTIETSDVCLDETFEPLNGRLVVPGPYVMLSVTDTGTGMSPEILEKIFEPFFTTKEAGKGTGLGLSTTYGIIEQHNGYMGADSEPGKGTTFKVYLPSIEGKVEATERDDLPMVKGTETILVVDDDSTVREFVVDVLQSSGYKVLEASCAKDALKICEDVQSKIDILLTDLVMLGMNGTELAEIFKRKKPGSKVIFMSGYRQAFFSDSDVSIPKGLFVQKPLTCGKLTARIREALDA